MQVDGRWVRFGLANDSKQTNEQFKSGDLVGITPRMVMPEHIGQIWGIFTNAECKPRGWKFTPGDKRAVAQLVFNNHVIKYGGIAGFCTSVIDYHRLIGYYP
ncbi:MAG: VRR-NUC domain-containing protein [Siphoviridae sp. ctdc_1]|nr:MAG: VRR-NUC domain-containing protein [Siphoviridae sp. ctdc_1]